MDPGLTSGSMICGKMSPPKSRSILPGRWNVGSARGSSLRWGRSLMLGTPYSGKSQVTLLTTAAEMCRFFLLDCMGEIESVTSELESCTGVS